MVDNFIQISAIVFKVYQPKLFPITFNFICIQCKGSFIHFLTDGCYSIPKKCFASKKCKSKSFTCQKQSLKTIFVQRVKVQEIDPQGRVPRQMTCEFRQNLVGKVIAGQTITLTGTIMTQPTDQKDKKTQGIFTPFIKVNSLQHKSAYTKDEFYDKQLIERMKSDKNIFERLIKSYCPSIYGHELVKGGLLLGLIGGSNRNLNEQSPFRETSHILLIGDPGIGKSQLLKYSVEVLEHSMYVNSTLVTNTGLTISINRDNEQSLEAGALVLADNGICAIDQFDKANDISSLLEVMQQQTISIAKSGIICQLKCRVGIIASANPIMGCYNRNKSFRDNTKISNAILSRFDLIFLLVDKPDLQRDKKLSEHIMRIHNKKKRKIYNEQKQNTINHYRNNISLSERYSQVTEQLNYIYSLTEIKKYLNYIRNQIHPTLSQEASEVIKGFYIALRQNYPNGSFQITNRQLQSLVRLAMARARVQCRSQVNQEDAIEVTQLMQESLFDSFQQMGYNINHLRNQVGKSKIVKKNGELSLPKQRAMYISELTELSDQRGNDIWQWGQLVKVAKDLELNIGDFYSFIQRLNQDGTLLLKGNRKYLFQKSKL